MGVAEKLALLDGAADELTQRTYRFRTELAGADLAGLHLPERVANKLVEKFPDDKLKDTEKARAPAPARHTRSPAPP